MTIRFPAETGGSIVTVGATTEIIKASLRTKDARAAKDRHALALAHLKSFWDRVRKGPQPLTHKQVIALAGHVYHTFANACEDDPVSPALWRRVAEMNEEADRGTYGPVQFMILNGDVERRRVAMEKRFGGLADAMLTYHGVVTDERSREQLIEALLDVSQQAAKKLERNAKGDYRADPDASRFPAWVPNGGPTNNGSLTITGLFERWAREALALGRTKKTVSEYRSLIERFVAFLGHDDALRIAQADIVRW
jgi:hypothetical protein